MDRSEELTVGNKPIVGRPAEAGGLHDRGHPCEQKHRLSKGHAEGGGAVSRALTTGLSINYACQVKNDSLSVNPEVEQLDIEKYKCTIFAELETTKAKRKTAPFARLKTLAQRRSQHQKS